MGKDYLFKIVGKVGKYWFMTMLDNCSWLQCHIAKFGDAFFCLMFDRLKLDGVQAGHQLDGWLTSCHLVDLVDLVDGWLTSCTAILRNKDVWCGLHCAMVNPLVILRVGGFWVWVSEDTRCWENTKPNQERNLPLPVSTVKLVYLLFVNLGAMSISQLSIIWCWDTWSRWVWVEALSKDL